MLHAITKEISMVGNRVEKVETIYFGGGTPSILHAEEVNSVLQQIHLQYDVAVETEITLEANPDDITEAKLQQWKIAGINRLSIGVQSFFEEDLQWMNRAHNAVHALGCLQLAKKYFDNITIDLIYGVPGLTHEKWQQNVKTAIDIGIPHLSCYALTVEPKTPLNKLISTGKKNDVEPALQSEQFLLLMDWLATANYEHYEISNFAMPGFRSKHNSSYWLGKPYWGFGPGAHSYNGSERWWNIANNQKYIDAMAAGVLPYEKEVLTDTQKTNEYIMISLRTKEGIDVDKLKPEHKPRILKAAASYIRNGLILKKGQFLSLTNQGKLFADGIAADLFE